MASDLIETDRQQSSPFSRLFDCLTWIQCYAHGVFEPRYSMPAVIVRTGVHPWMEESPYHHSVTFWEPTSDVCPDCGMRRWVLAAIVDFNYDRATDFHYNTNEYTHGSILSVGVELYAFECNGGRAQ